MKQYRLLNALAGAVLAMLISAPLDVFASSSSQFAQAHDDQSPMLIAMASRRQSYSSPVRRQAASRSRSRTATRVTPVKRTRVVTKNVGHSRTIAVSTKRHTRKIASRRNRVASGKQRHALAAKKAARKVAAAKPRYAYAMDFFMWSTPGEAASALTFRDRRAVKKAFHSGYAGSRSPQDLVAAGAFDDSQPLQGGIFQRRKPVQFVILHSTETARPADGQRVIRSWNHGMRHPGAQFVVDRDGTIYQAVNPDFGTVHVDVFRTKQGVDNDNSVGIEIVRAGKQKYTATQLQSVTRLVAYLQDRYSVADEHVLGHGEVQPSNRTDPVGFDWVAFGSAKSTLKTQSTAAQKRKLNSASADVGAGIVETQVDKAKAVNKMAKQYSWTFSYCCALFS